VLFLRFYATLAQHADQVAVATVFQQVYGASLDDVWDQARVASPTEPGVPIWECASDSLTLDGTAADLSDRCDGRGRVATFSLAGSGALAWQGLTLSSGFNVTGCDPSKLLYVQQIGWTGALETGALALQAGRYSVAPVAGTGAVGLLAAGDVIASACAEAAPLDLPASASNVTLAIGNSSDPRFVRLHPAAGQALTLARQWDDPVVPDVTVAQVELCLDCSGACQPFDDSMAVAFADGQILRISALDAPSGITVVRFSYR